MTRAEKEKIRKQEYNKRVKTDSNLLAEQAARSKRYRDKKKLTDSDYNKKEAERKLGAYHEKQRQEETKKAKLEAEAAKLEKAQKELAKAKKKIFLLQKSKYNVERQLMRLRAKRAVTRVNQAKSKVELVGSWFNSVSFLEKRNERGRSLALKKMVMEFS